MTLRNVCLSLAASVAAAPLILADEPTAPPSRRMDRSRLNIGAYILEPYARSEHHVKDVADCGIDFIVCLGLNGDRTVLDTFSKYHLGAIVSGVLPGWWGGDGKNAGTMAQRNPMDKYVNAAAAFEDHPAIWGIDTGDEPSALDFPYYGEVIRFTEKNFPNQFPYLNLYPNYASVAKNNATETVNQLGTATYQEHIDQYCKNVGTDYICYDYYMYSASVAGHLENLRIVSDACRKTGRSLWIVLQVNSLYPEKFISENQLRAQAYSAMAFGAETIIWACYSGGWWYNKVLDDNGEKTQQYDKLKHVNGEIHALGTDYMRFRNTSTHFVGSLPENDTPFGMNASAFTPELSTGIFLDVHASDNSPLIIGQMTSRKQDDGAQALWIFAANDMSDTGGHTAIVTFKCPGRTVKVNGAPLEQAEDGTYTLRLAPSAAAIIIAE